MTFQKYKIHLKGENSRVGLIKTVHYQQCKVRRCQCPRLLQDHSTYERQLHSDKVPGNKATLDEVKSSLKFLHNGIAAGKYLTGGQFAKSTFDVNIAITTTLSCCAKTTLPYIEILVLHLNNEDSY